MRLFLVDAFTSRPFGGNPAAVVLLDREVDARLMQSIASEMNQAETAFLSTEGRGYKLRWFTPTREVELCGHATLASAHVLYETREIPAAEEAVFQTLSGELRAEQTATGIRMSFPTEPAAEVPTPPQIRAMFGSSVLWTGQNRMDLLVELDDECAVRSYQPDIATLASIGGRGVILTAAAKDTDFVSRFFAPNYGVNEDSVTGSAHCCLGPYWSQKLGKAETLGFQASTRGGYVTVVDRGDRVDLLGSAVTVVRGELDC